MAKRMDPAAAWAAYRSGHDALRGWLGELPPEHWAGPSVLPGWTVADLAAHIALVADAVTATVAAPRGVAAHSLSEYLTTYEAAAAGLSDLTLAIAREAGHDKDRILAAVDERFAAAQATVDERGLDDVVLTTRRIPARQGDYLLTRVVEIAVHADDLARSTPSVPRPPSPATPRGSPSAPSSTCWPTVRRAAASRCGSRRSPPSSASRGRGTPGARRRTPSTSRRLSGCGWPPGASRGPTSSPRAPSSPAASAPTCRRTCRCSSRRVRRST
nr:maleylpyruvate isomerase N-terminal domain-containing protein [Jiangella alba]